MDQDLTKLSDDDLKTYLKNKLDSSLNISNESLTHGKSNDQRVRAILETVKEEMKSQKMEFSFNTAPAESAPPLTYDLVITRRPALTPTPPKLDPLQKEVKFQLRCVQEEKQQYQQNLKFILAPTPMPSYAPTPKPKPGSMLGG